MYFYSSVCTVMFEMLRMLVILRLHVVIDCSLI